MARLKLSTTLRKPVILAALLGVIIGISGFFGLSFTSERIRLALVEQLKSYSGRDIRIDGEVEICISIFPQLLVQRIHISNPEDFDNKDFINVSEVRVDASLMPLLFGQLHLSDISADQAKIYLTKKKDGHVNWSFNNSRPPSKTTDTETTDSSYRTSSTRRLSIGKFQLTDVAIIYRDESRGRAIDTRLEHLLIDIKDIAKPSARISGDIQGQPYEMEFKSDALNVFASGQPWSINGTGHIARKQTELAARFEQTGNEINGDIDINVDRVNLGSLLDRLEIISGQEAATDNINIHARLHGADLIELYEQAEIEVELGKGYWDLQPRKTGKKKQLTFTRATAFTSWKKPVELTLDGNIAKEAFKLTFRTNRLSEFFDDLSKLDVDITAVAAGTDVTMKGTLDLPVETKKLEIDISVRSEGLERLNPILDTDFPPFDNFSVSGNLIANDKGYVLKSAEVSIGDTKLRTAIVIETDLPKPLWNISLNSRQFQLNDFKFIDWKIDQDHETSKTATEEEQKSFERPAITLLRHIEDIVRTPHMHLNLNLNADRVISGEDRLGKARFKLHMRDGALSITDADIELPGGRIKSSIALKTGNNSASGHLVLDIDKLDYGITTRLFEPGSIIDGVISTRIDLSLGGRDFTRLLDKATGQLDIAVWPKNTRPARALNLWTINLYLILLPELNKKESLVNCMVGLMDMENGTMKEEFFAVDTTRLWITGNIDVDFRQEHVQLSLFPQSKKARLFAFQSPIRADGSFSDIDLLISPVDLAGSYVSFITSPLHVPTRWIFGDKVEEDGSAVCERLFDREYVTKLHAEVERKQQQEVDEMLESD
jgi:uncharacterized protein involved in outer membrane biogenesis